MPQGFSPAQEAAGGGNTPEDFGIRDELCHKDLPLHRKRQYSTGFIV